MRSYKIIFLFIVPLFVCGMEAPISVSVRLWSGREYIIDGLDKPDLPNGARVKEFDPVFFEKLKSSVIPLLCADGLFCKQNTLSFVQAQNYIQCIIEMKFTAKQADMPIGNSIHGNIVRGPTRYRNNRKEYMPNRFCYEFTNEYCRVTVFPGMLSNKCVGRFNEKLLENQNENLQFKFSLSDVDSSDKTTTNMRHICHANRVLYSDTRQNIKTILYYLRKSSINMDRHVHEIVDSLLKNTVLFQNFILIVDDHDHVLTNYYRSLYVDQKTDIPFNESLNEARFCSIYNPRALNANLLSINQIPFAFYYLNLVKDLPDALINDELLFGMIGELFKHQRKLSEEEIMSIMQEYIGSLRP